MKRETTKHGATSSEKQRRQDWIDCWRKMPQKKIREWIEAILVHIKEVIKANGGNEYKEGRGNRKRNPNRVH